AVGPAMGHPLDNGQGREADAGLALLVLAEIIPGEQGDGQKAQQEPGILEMGEFHHSLLPRPPPPDLPLRGRLALDAIGAVSVFPDSAAGLVRRMKSPVPAKRAPASLSSSRASANLTRSVSSQN